MALEAPPDHCLDQLMDRERHGIAAKGNFRSATHVSQRVDADAPTTTPATTSASARSTLVNLCAAPGASAGEPPEIDVAPGPCVDEQRRRASPSMMDGWRPSDQGRRSRSHVPAYRLPGPHRVRQAITLAARPRHTAASMPAKKTDTPKGAKSPSQLIDGRIKELGDWRGETLAKVRALIKQVGPWRHRRVEVARRPDLVFERKHHLHRRDLQRQGQGDVRQGREARRPEEAVQLEPRRQREACDRLVRRRQGQRRRVQGARPRRSRAERVGRSASRSRAGASPCATTSPRRTGSRGITSRPPAAGGRGPSGSSWPAPRSSRSPTPTRRRRGSGSRRPIGSLPTSSRRAPRTTSSTGSRATRAR